MACALEVGHCLTLMAGDMEGAAQLILHRAETGQSLQPNDNYKVKSRVAKKEVDPKMIKDMIVNKYGYVDETEDARYHRPTIKREVNIAQTLLRIGIQFYLFFRMTRK